MLLLFQVLSNFPHNIGFSVYLIKIARTLTQLGKLQAFRAKNYVEVWHSTAQFLWLIANAWWMLAELHDHEYPDASKLYEEHTVQAGYIMRGALAWLAIYYLVVRLFSLIPRPSGPPAAAYDHAGVFVPRCTYLFPTWRAYENIHILFWLGKDCAWNNSWPVVWWIFVVPTVAIALDFVWTTSFRTGYGVDHVHYIVQFTWVREEERVARRESE